MRRVLAIARNEVRRLRGMHFNLVVIQPLLSLFLLGYCTVVDVRGLGVEVLDPTGGADGRSVTRALRASGAFGGIEAAGSMGEVEDALRRGEAKVAVLVPSRLPAELRRDHRAPVRVLADGADPVVAGVGLGYAARTVEAAGQDGRDRPDSAPRGGFAARTRVWWNPSLRGDAAMAIGAVLFHLLWVMRVSSGALISERVAGTLGRLRTSPVSPVELWLGLVLGNGAAPFAGAVFLIALAAALFGTPFRGSPALALLALGLFTLVHLNLGYALPLVARTLEQRSVITYGIAFVTLSFSGFFVPLPCLPDWAQRFAELLPMKHGLILCRAIFLKGAPLEALGRELAILGAFAAATSLLALWAVRRELRD